LEALEQQASNAQAQVDLFAPAPAPAATALSQLEAFVASLNPDTMSPREAMDAIYQLKAL
jgi:DNA mismatch repair protein MutS